jgi:hypothetical protein
MRCASVAKASITAPGWRSASSATISASFLRTWLAPPGVAARAWRGRGLWIVQPIARSASQPRCSATFASPSSAAMTAATFLELQTPPSSGGVFSRSRSMSRTSAVRIVASAPLPRRRSPNEDGPNAL